MFEIILTIIGITLIPTLELRMSIPYGIIALQNAGFPWFYAPIIAIITNAILGPIIYIILDNFLHILLKVKAFRKIYNKKLKHIHEKIFPKTEIYGDIALAAFIAVPLPGTGSYTGALAALILGIKNKHFMWINFIGVLIAGIFVTLITKGLLII